ncbi:MAG: methyltransferase domain-containing protein [Armatimonadota bacterium]|nr:MAG: methyltransferase domain-containing protein [Armatimonadota bacterium]
MDRHWIDGFLQEHADCIRGRVLEFGDDRYTRRFGLGGVEGSDVLYPKEGRPEATIVANLVDGKGIPSDAFDCIICTHTLQYIYEVSPAVATLHRALKPDGVLLLTVPGISPICRIEKDRWGEYWHFTTQSVQRLLEEVFPASAVTVKGYGNVLAAVAFLHGLAAEELQQEEFAHFDPDYQLIVAARATKPSQ